MSVGTEITSRIPRTASERSSSTRLKPRVERRTETRFAKRSAKPVASQREAIPALEPGRENLRTAQAIRHGHRRPWNIPVYIDSNGDVKRDCSTKRTRWGVSGNRGGENRLLR